MVLNEEHAGSTWRHASSNSAMHYLATYDVIRSCPFCLSKSDLRIDKDISDALGTKSVIKRYQSAGAAGEKPYEEQLHAWKERPGGLACHD